MSKEEESPSPSSSSFKYTLPLDSEEASLATVGGKGYNLGILSRAGTSTSSSAASVSVKPVVPVRVPPGFTVTVAAYHDFVRENGLQEKIQKELQVLDDKQKQEEGHDNTVENTALLEQVSRDIRQLFRACKVSATLRDEIDRRLDALFSKDDNDDKTTDKNNTESNTNQTTKTLAVRSSATCEDRPDASFAGQHDTYLNVRRDDVCAHVVDCFGSLFTSRAVAYRRRNHSKSNGGSHFSLDDGSTGMAVVVQKLVPSDASGVLFTANPLNGRRTEHVLEAVSGLGEALVSGLTEPDRYVISCGTTSATNGAGNDVVGADDDDDGSDSFTNIKDVRVGAKQTAIRPVQGGGVVTNKQEEKNESTTVLTNEEVKELSVMGRHIQELFGGTPQDIEWAKERGGAFQIVQSRPITTLFPCPTVPADLERPQPQVFFSFNAVQGIVSPFFPAGSEAIRNILGGLLRYASWGTKGKTREFLQVVAERVYINVSPCLRNSIGRKIIQKALTLVEPGILSGMETVLPDIPIETGMSPLMFLRMVSIMSMVVPRFLYAFMFPDSSRKTLIRLMNDRVASIQQEADEANSLAELMRLKDRSLSGFFPFAIFRFIPRIAAGMSPLYFLNRLASNVPNGKNLVLTITRGLPHNVTTEMDLELWKAAKIIRSDSNAHSFVRQHDVDALASTYLENKLPAAAQIAVTSFMQVYGVRGRNEIDFGRPRWREEPAALFQTIKSYIDIDDENAPDVVFAKGQKAAEEAIEELGQAIGKPWLVRFLAQRTRSIAGVRELPKFTMIRIMGILRQKYLEQGARLVKSGVFKHPRDIFFLLDSELQVLASDDMMDCKALVARRKCAMAKEDERLAIPRVIASDGFAFLGGASAASCSEIDGAFVGEPVSPGTVEGIVHVVYDPSKSSLKPGEVLVCHGTDPSWTPLFLAAGGLVMEVGGLMTHGSVVAREYGIPAVVGLEKITERLQTGQRIRVDGSNGVVSILDESN